MKKAAFKIHSYFALYSLLPILVISLTGSILVFKKELDFLLMPSAATVQGEGLSRLPLDDLKHTIDTAFPYHIIGTWEVFDDQHQADAVYLIKHGTYDWFKVFLDPYHNQILSEPVGLHDYITDWLVEFHYTFMLDLAGTGIGAVFAFTMLGIAITGLMMYHRFWKLVARLQCSRAKVMLFSDVHKFIGILTSPIFLILSITGLYWNISVIVHELEEHAEHGEIVLTQQGYSRDISLTEIVAQAEQRIEGFTPTYLSLAYEPGSSISVYGKVESGNTLHSNYGSGAHFDPGTGKLTGTWDIRTSAFTTQLLDSFRHLHFGLFGGLFVQILWCIAGLMPLILVITGTYLWAHRRKKRTQSRLKRRMQQKVI